MAIPVGRTIKELDKMAVSLGVRDEVIPSGKNGRIMKDDYVHPIRKYHINQRYGSLENAPDHFKWILSMKSPMLALRMDHLDELIQSEIWESDEWYLEEKLNGARMLIVKDSSGINIYSRHNSDTDLLPINYTSRIVFPDNFDIDSLGEDFIIDTELTSDNHQLNTTLGKHGVVTETQLQAVTALLSSTVERAIAIQKKENTMLVFNSFDCVYYGGSWLFSEPLQKRRKITMYLWKQLSELNFNIRPVSSNISNKKAFHKNIILSGREGTIAKNIHGLYVPDSTRRKDGWIKIKRSVSEMLSGDKSLEDSFGDTVEGWISGFEPATEGKNREGYIGNILVSVKIRRADGTEYDHCIAKISGIDMKLRQDMTEVVGGEPRLKASYYDRVVEIDGAGVSSRELRFSHAVFCGFRYDVEKADCVMSEDFLKKMVL